MSANFIKIYNSSMAAFVTFVFLVIIQKVTRLRSVAFKFPRHVENALVQLTQFQLSKMSRNYL